MTITDLYNISQALYSVQKANGELEVSDLVHDEALLEIYDSLDSQQLQNLDQFVRNHRELYESFPSHYQSKEDMQQREYIIESIEEKIREDLTSIFDL